MDGPLCGPWARRARLLPPSGAWQLAGGRGSHNTQHTPAGGVGGGLPRRWAVRRAGEAIWAGRPPSPLCVRSCWAAGDAPAICDLGRAPRAGSSFLFARACVDLVVAIAKSSDLLAGLLVANMAKRVATWIDSKRDRAEWKQPDVQTASGSVSCFQLKHGRVHPLVWPELEWVGGREHAPSLPVFCALQNGFLAHLMRHA
jgi:hypothetical protein